MEQYQQYINIDECVLAYLDESEQNKSSRYYKCWQLAYRAADELGLDIFYSIKTERLEVSANGVAMLPHDYLSYCKIGQINSCGEVVSFIRNDGIDNYAGLLNNSCIPNTEATYGQCFYDNSAPVFYNYWDDGCYNTLRGHGGCCEFGTFKIDEANGVLVLPHASFSNSIVMEYKASPTEDRETRIPKQFKEAVIAYIAWKDIRYLPSSRRGNISDKRDRRHEYYHERRLAKARYQPLYLQEAWHYAKTFTPSLNSVAYNYSYDGCGGVCESSCKSLPTHSHVTPTPNPNDVPTEIILPIGSTNYTVPAGKLVEHILFLQQEPLVVSVGSAPGETDYCEPIEKTKRWALATIDQYFEQSIVLYFNGVTDTTLIKVYIS